MRLTRGLVLTASLCATLSAPTLAGADDVVAYGRLEGTRCVFDEPVQVTARVRADRDCRLLLEPDGTTLSPPAKAQPKRRTDEPAVPTAVGAPGGAVGVMGRLATQAAERAGDTGGYTLWHGWAEYQVFNELDDVIYHDRFDVQYRQYHQDGTFDGFAGAGRCATGAGVYPHNPTVESCTWLAGYLGPYVVSFTSSGTYVDRILLVEYDRRDVDLNYVHDADGGFSQSCPRITEIHPLWGARCVIDKEEVL